MSSGYPIPLPPSGDWDFSYVEGTPLREADFAIPQEPLPPEYEERPPLWRPERMTIAAVQLWERGPYTDPVFPNRTLVDGEFLVRYFPVSQPPVGTPQAETIRYVEPEMIVQRTTGFVTPNSNPWYNIDPDETNVTWVRGTQLALMMGPTHPPIIIGRWRSNDDAFQPQRPYGGWLSAP